MGLKTANSPRRARCISIRATAANNAGCRYTSDIRGRRVQRLFHLLWILLEAGDCLKVRPEKKQRVRAEAGACACAWLHVFLCVCTYHVCVYIVRCKPACLQQSCVAFEIVYVGPYPCGRSKRRGVEGSLRWVSFSEASSITTPPSLPPSLSSAIAPMR